MRDSATQQQIVVEQAEAAMKTAEKNVEIQITQNQSDIAVQLLSRYWRIKQARVTAGNAPRSGEVQFYSALPLPVEASPSLPLTGSYAKLPDCARLVGPGPG